MIKTGIYGQFAGQSDILENIMDVAELQIVGWCQTQCGQNKEFANKLELKKYSEVRSLMNEVDAIIAFSPMSDLNNVEFLVKNSKHVFFEPLSKYSNEDIKKLVNIIDEANVKVQAGFHYRFNNTFLAAKPFIKSPKFIQSNNFKKFGPSTKTCSVLMDMLINDIDIVLSVIKSDIKNISANATAIGFDEPDILNVRIEFMNGSVAQLTSGRIATEDSHVVNFYCDKDYTSIDLCKNKAWQVKKRDINNELELFSENIGDLVVVPIPVKPNNQYYDEFVSFARAIVYNKNPEVDFETLIKTYKIADEIKRKIKIFI
ncbi:MAG: Gfo/Idh/MocA family oxidoreductase [Bacteroidales bacterium]|jgi:predicted dehydrogenase|nr:Gfo/Idh/MocA family oxidoreductase [Bacteroidales bacterium]